MDMLSTSVCARLDRAATGFGRRVEAASIIRRLSHEQLNGLEPRAQLELAQALTQGLGTGTQMAGAFGLGMAAMTAGHSAFIGAFAMQGLAVLRTFFPSPALTRLYRAVNLPGQKAERLAIRKVVAGLDADPVFQKARQGWEDMSGQERQDALRHIARRHSQIIGQPPIASILFEEKGPRITVTGARALRMGGFNPARMHIVMNTHEEAGFDNFGRMLDTLIHENTHYHQQLLLNQAAAGALPEGDPRQLRAGLMSVCLGVMGYFRGGANYRANPVERDANFWGGRVARALVYLPRRREIQLKWATTLAEALQKHANSTGAAGLSQIRLGMGRVRVTQGKVNAQIKTSTL